MAVGSAENLEVLSRAIARAVSSVLALETMEEIIEIPVGVSARHVHLTDKHIEALFGKGYQLKPLRALSQPGMYAALESVIIVGPRGILQNVRVLGPPRQKTQVEISKTDGFLLGIDTPVRDSGNHAGTPGCIIVGPNGAVKLQEGVICAMRHIHMPLAVAERLHIQNKELVRVKTSGKRKVIFDKVLVRVAADFVLEIHVDTDEANAAGLKTGDRVKIIGKN